MPKCNRIRESGLGRTKAYRIEETGAARTKGNGIGETGFSTDYSKGNMGGGKQGQQ